MFVYGSYLGNEIIPIQWTRIQKYLIKTKVQTALRAIQEAPVG